MKILITGSHFTPAQAVIEELQKFRDFSTPLRSARNDRRMEIVYVGRKHTIEGDLSISAESQILPKMGVKFIPIIAGRLRRNFDIYTITSLLKIPIGFLQSFYVVSKERPNVVLSFGGYVGLPVVISAWLLSIPIIVHEQTLVSGLANTISNFFADTIAVSFEKSYAFNAKKIVLTGNPIRKELIDSRFRGNDTGELKQIFASAKKENLPIIYITGGNQGAHVINETVSEILANLTAKFFVIHQTGDSKYGDFEKLAAQRKHLKYPERYLIKKWMEVEDLAFIYRHTQLVISRAGANTLLELAYFGLPTIAIPLPYLYKDEQNINALHFKKLGLCEILSQHQLSGKNLLKEIHHIFKNYEYYKKAAILARAVVIPDAGARVAQKTWLLVK